MDAVAQPVAPGPLTAQQALALAVDLAGGQNALARLINRKQGHIWYWLSRSGKCPADVAIEIERALHGKITRHQLRPDLFPAAEPPEPPPDDPLDPLAAAGSIGAAA